MYPPDMASTINIKKHKINKIKFNLGLLDVHVMFDILSDCEYNAAISIRK